MMSGKDLRRVHVIRQVVEKTLTQVEAASLLGLTDRQILRLLQRMQHAGDQGLVHRGWGTPLNRRIAASVKTKVLRLYDKQPGGFGPTLAGEKRAERDGMTLSAETLRGWLLAAGVTHFRRRQRPHRAWRARKAPVGELVQLDGSHQDWGEGRGPAGILMAYIDDASSRVFARFYDHEGTRPAMDSFQRYVRPYGLPLALYADKHTTYLSPAEPTVEEQLAGTTPRSQFGRALDELGIELIVAHSPQAKGRVERRFKTIPDWLMKELRLAGIATMADANRFMEGYLPIYNRRFAVPPTQAADLHRSAPPARTIERSPCLKTTRCLREDFTITYHEQCYQLHDTIRATHVQVEQPLEGTLRLTHHGRALAYQVIAAQPMTSRNACPPIPSPPRRVRQRPDHPWCKRLLPERGARTEAART